MTAPLARSVTVAQSVARAPADVYAYVVDPRNLPEWAPGFALSVQKKGGRWIVATAEGPMEILFAPENAFGVMDHVVEVAPGVQGLNPMRVVPNGEGSEVLFTLFVPEGLGEPEFTRLVATVEADLRLLREVLER